MVADFGIYSYKFCVVYAVVFNVKAFTDNVGVEFWHKVFCHHWSGNAAEEVASVLSCIRNYAVHFVKAFAVNQVSDKRNFVE